MILLLNGTLLVVSIGGVALNAWRRDGPAAIWAAACGISAVNLIILRQS